MDIIIYILIAVAFVIYIAYELKYAPVIPDDDIPLETRETNAKKLKQLINNYPTKNKEGFTSTEIKQLVKELSIDLDTFYDKLGVNTCMIINGEAVTYHCDVYKGVICTIEDREQTLFEWD